MLVKGGEKKQDSHLSDWLLAGEWELPPEWKVELGADEATTKSLVTLYLFNTYSTISLLSVITLCHLIVLAM